MQEIRNLEKQMTPAQKAGVEAGVHILFIGIITALLAFFSYADQFKSVPLNTILIAAASQMVLAMLIALKTYFSSIGKPQYVAAVTLAQSRVEAMTPVAPKITAQGQQIAAIAEQIIAPPLSVQASEIDPALNGAFETVSTIPNLAIVKKQFQTPAPTV